MNVRGKRKDNRECTRTPTIEGIVHRTINKAKNITLKAKMMCLNYESRIN